MLLCENFCAIFWKKDAERRPFLRYSLEKAYPLHGPALVVHGRVDVQPQGGADIGVAQQFADAFHVHAALHAPCGVAVPQAMEIPIPHPQRSNSAL